LELLGDFEDALVFANVASPLALALDAVASEIENADKILEGVYNFASEIIKLFQKGFSWQQVLQILWASNKGLSKSFSPDLNYISFIKLKSGFLSSK
jgi:hypothetical protein